MGVIKSSPRRWEYLAARDPWFSALVAVHLTVIITIAVLAHISGRHQGIATLPDSSLSDSGRIWTLPLLWTSVPTLVMTLLALAVSSTVYAVRDRQPFADMTLNDGSTLDKMLLLDYRTTFGAFQWIKAARNRHWPLSLSLLSTILLSVAVPPLSARLFTKQLINRSTPTPLPITHRLNLSILSPASQALPNAPSIDWKVLLDLSAAITLFNATPSAWSDTSYAYEHFRLPPPPSATTTSANPPPLIHAPVTAYTADADCRPVHNFTAARSAQRGVFSLRGSDRGCVFALEQATLNAEPIVLGTYVVRRCGLAAGRGRVVVVSGRGSGGLEGEGGNGEGGDGVVRGLRVFACMTGYLSVEGVLTVRGGGDGRVPEMVAFRPTGEVGVATGVGAGAWSAHEEAILDVLAFNPNGRWLTSGFGGLVLSRAVAKKYGLAAVLDPAVVIDVPEQDELIAAVRVVLRQVHIAAVANVFMRPVEESVDDGLANMGSASWSEPRLVVVPWAAAVVLALLSLRGLLGHLAVWYPTLISEHLQPVDQMMKDAFDVGPEGMVAGWTA
ncbi:hypothetical protein F5144DRAFT_630744 [Chaetomium tenue]|uniref:Uncharacterized protein n=1 Tax=Chaetomium tenue TaxID=1854479 RepID=A0ACB7P141_9PEZI|nr:hypothetical protein F5144DRAFT_630744 [Chaetomium globosum]